MTYSQFREGLRVFHIELDDRDFGRLVRRYDPHLSGADTHVLDAHVLDAHGGRTSTHIDTH
eukprot:1181014-Prorocentrum_minimum.AAC.1